ncbi:MAG: thioredoxin [Deltaproteobacteria bacterium]|nr:thioredoxin [Deltaproteobacteria bacterium]
MNADHIIVPCGNCGTRNRIPRARLKESPVCGRCRTPISVSAAYPGLAVDATDRTFQQEVLQFPGSVLVFFWATWCGYCRSLMPVIGELAKKYAGRIKFVRLQTDTNQATASRYDVLSLPTLLLFKNGRQVNRLVGALPREQLEQQLSALL